MSVSEKEKPHTAAEMLQSFRGMIEGGTWSEVLAEMPEPLLRKHLETLCHAALLSQDSGQAVAFLLALSEKAKACKVLPEQYERNQIYADVIVVDPPRKGCDEKCLETIVKMSPNRVVYVSCNSSTLARDVKYLEERGYRTERVRCVDMFPHSGHVETVVKLKKW